MYVFTAQRESDAMHHEGNRDTKLRSSSFGLT
jgi:hypothetical protein